MYNIGKRIKELRIGKGLTQEKLADQLGVTYQSVSKWENGVTYPDLSLIVPLSGILKVSTDELLGANERNQRMLELEFEYEEAKKRGGVKEALVLSELGKNQYPDNMKWLYRYAKDLWCFQ